ncbi:histone H1-like [Trematomus bernacchii]|uniref:histone H1-like n=1 Tax=Trematomus bernacchii TaxID=40690 RepID=UPI00146D60A5|nr:histone H1-like [Trematomus bernacchii]
MGWEDAMAVELPKDDNELGKRTRDDSFLDTITVMDDRCALASKENDDRHAMANKEMHDERSSLRWDFSIRLIRPENPPDSIMATEEAPTEVAVAPAKAPAKSPKKKAAKPAKKVGPGAAELILKAVTASKDRKGISYIAVKKALAAQGYEHTAHIKRAVKRLLENGSLVQVKGIGATGSFKAAEKPKKVAKKPAAKAKKPAAAAAKKPAAKKPAAKKPAAKKPAAKKPAAKKAATPKKAKKPATAAKKTPVKKITKSPKKKVVAKKAATPKKAVKKAPARKAAKK